ncbi:MAG TPA: hypothetical protein VFJ82_00215 [Longimicrobium sp.]|nr:hypothetical protein [Longimicrobium sp.]
MRFPTLAAVLIAPLALGACVTANATLLGPRRAPVPEDQVRVFLDDDEIPASCERLAIIDTRGDADVTTESQMVRAAKRRAGKLGANAIQLRGTREPGTGTRVAAAIGVPGITADRRGQMLAFHCADEQAGISGTVRELLGLAD